MGWAVQKCTSNEANYFATPWQSTLIHNAETLQPKLLEYLRQTVENGYPQGGDVESLCMFDEEVNGKAKLTIHPYALYTLLSEGNKIASGDALGEFSERVFAMWAALSSAMEKFEEALEGNSGKDISEAKGKTMEVLLAHVLNLRHGTGPIQAVSRFPTVVDKGKQDKQRSDCESDTKEIADLIRDLPVGKRIVITPLSAHNIVDVVLLEKNSPSKLCIDLYEAKLYDATLPTHEHENKYFSSLVGLLHLARRGALGKSDIVVTFHYVVAVSVDKRLPVRFDPLYACQYPLEYIDTFGATPNPPTIEHMEELLREHRVTLNSPRCHGTQKELEALLTRPLMLLLPDSFKFVPK